MRKHVFFGALAAFFALNAVSAADLTVQIKSLKGVPVPLCDDGKADCGQVMTIADAATFALLGAPDDQQNGRSGQDKGDQKMRRFSLAERIQKDPKGALSIDDLKLIKDTVAVSFGPLIVGRVNQAIDESHAPKK